MNKMIGQDPHRCVIFPALPLLVEVIPTGSHVIQIEDMCVSVPAKGFFGWRNN